MAKAELRFSKDAHDKLLAKHIDLIFNPNYLKLLAPPNLVMERGPA